MSRDVISEIKTLVESNPVMLFMKGTPAEPMCGFSAQVVQILNSYGVTYQSVNVLDDWDVREGVKQFTNWPTIPQLYVKSEFIGGCDILMEMHRKGELQGVLEGAK